MQVSTQAISGVLDGNGTFLREIRVGAEEVFRGVGFVARDENWGTPSLAATPRRADVGQRIDIESAGELSTRSGDLNWSVTWTFDESAVEVVAKASSQSGFSTNRTGLVVLHSLGASRGRPVRVTHPDRTQQFTQFPTLIAPHQPFFDVAAMEYETRAGHRLRISFEGEVFEIEDQRNWTDASYKTYCRPLRLPYPYRIGPGVTIRQRVRIEIFAIKSLNGRGGGRAPVEASIGSVPAIGTSLPPGRPHAGAQHALKILALNFTALEVDLADTGWKADFDARLALVTGKLRIDIRPAPGPATLDALSALEPVVTHSDLLGVTLWGADDAMLGAARDIFLKAPLGAGSPAFFTELNRTEPLPAQADYLSWPSNPTAHGVSDDTIGETTEVSEDILATIHAKAAARPLHVGPMTLRMRFNPVATTPEGRRGPPPDPRQGTIIAAAWAVATLCGYIDETVRALDFFEPSGAKGLIDEMGAVTPAGAVLSRLARQSGSLARALRWAGSPRARGLLIETSEGALLCVAYMRQDEVTLALPPRRWRLERLGPSGFWSAPPIGETLAMAGFSVAWLTAAP